MRVFARVSDAPYQHPRDAVATKPRLDVDVVQHTRLVRNPSGDDRGLRFERSHTHRRAWQHNFTQKSLVLSVPDDRRHTATTDASAQPRGQDVVTVGFYGGADGDQIFTIATSRFSSASRSSSVMRS